jgi:hypothetical protein
MDTEGRLKMKRTILNALDVAAIVMALSAATVAQQAVAQTPAPGVKSTKQGIPEGGVKVTPDTYIRAETDRQFAEIVRMAGGVNRFYHFRSPTPLDKQNVVRMNRDTLYSMGIVDTSTGATISVPELPEGRYASVYLADNDHYVPFVIYTAGTHQLPRDTKYLALGIRIQVFNPKDPDEIALVNKLQDQFVIKANSADPLPEFKWDLQSLKTLTAQYEKASAQYSSWKGMQGPRGKVDERTRHIAAAAAWGLFPEWDATYLNYSGGHDPKVCHKATYEVPENKAFWSITVYGNDGFMKSENNIVNSSNVTLNADGTATVYFGSKELCGGVTNRLDVTEGWNFLLRIYRPGASVLDGRYKLPKAEPIEGAAVGSKFASPADFGVTDYAYKISETDFNIKRSLAKARINEWAHQRDVSNVKTQQVIRENQDVIYSSAVVDVRGGATFSVPTSKSYHIIEVIDQQNYIVDVVYPGNSLTITPDNLTYGNYVYLNMRIRKLPDAEGGIDATRTLQGMATIKARSAVPYTAPDIVIDQAKMEAIRMALIKDVQAGKLPDTSRSQGGPYQTDPQAHLYATAYGWGGLSVEHAAYAPIANRTETRNGKASPSSITFTPPDIDYDRGGFWSITTYDRDGWLARDKAAISNSEATPNPDGSYTIRFNSPGSPNNVETPSPFTALLRVYVPRSKESAIQYLKTESKNLLIK